MKKRILRFIAGFMLAMLMIGICTIDSEGTMVPYVLCLVSIGWLSLFAYANKDRL